jgi:hypothetical protein
MKKVRITFDKGGIVRLDAEGFRGQGCRAFTLAFERVLGTVRATSVEKPELYDEPGETQEAR